MTKVFLSLGSNIERFKHITNALDELTLKFGDLIVSTVYESEAVGFRGNHFLNLVVALQAQKSLKSLSETLKNIENKNGRIRNGPKFSPRTLDIDILLFGDFQGNAEGLDIPRGEISQNAFVLLPLQEIAPQFIHPTLNISFQEMWKKYDKASQKLWKVSFNWQGKSISQG